MVHLTVKEVSLFQIFSHLNVHMHIIICVWVNLTISIITLPTAVVFVEFESLFYTVEESNTTVLVCVVANNTEWRFHVQVVPVTGTATGPFLCTFVYALLT